MVILKKFALLNYKNKETIYSKLVRNSLDFNVEVHNLCSGSNLQITLFRDHPSVNRIMETVDKTDVITKQDYNFDIENTIIRLLINEDDFMIDCGKKATIKIQEYNITRDFADFKKGKVAIIIDFLFDETTETTKVRSELKLKYSKNELKQENSLQNN